MKYIKDYIGVRTSEGQKRSDSGLYINDLPLSMCELNKENTLQFNEVFDSIQNRAAKVFEVNFTNLLSKKYKIKKGVDNFTIGETIDSETHFNPNNELRGVYVDCFIVKSAFHVIAIDDVKLHLNSPSDVSINIYEVNDNNLTLLDTFKVVGISGWNSFGIKKSYYGSRTIFIAYEAINITSSSTPLDESYSFQYGNLCHMFSHVFINGATYEDGLFTSTSDDTFGLSVTFDCNPHFSSLIANYKESLAVAWWYLLGSEFAKERIYTDRINKFSTIDLGKARDLHKALHGDYINELETFVDSINLLNDWAIEETIK